MVRPSSISQKKKHGPNKYEALPGAKVHDDDHEVYTY